MCYSFMSTCIKSIKLGFFDSWPGQTVVIVSKHLEESVDTTKLHQQSSRKEFPIKKSTITKNKFHKMKTEPKIVLKNELYKKLI